ncbi:MAG TPA: hypothetical protein VGQ53_16830 [Chitinophagaceae bacterium]|nr:hypothetical protein [Chitinophagaceae bacterium]
MKNFTLSHLNAATWSHCFRKLSFTFVKFFLLIICNPFVSKGQSFNVSQAVSSQQLPPELEKTIRNTLKQSSLKLQWIENNGQLGLPANVVAYFSSGTQTVFIERDRLRIIVVKSNDDEADFDLVKDKSSITSRSKNYHYNTFTILFKGSKGFSEYEKIKPFETKRNFIETRSSERNTTNVSSYGEVILKNIYPDIDLRLYSQESGQMEFDWIVDPYADASMIKMKFEGQEKLAINNSGDLEVKLAMGSFRIHLPESYYVTPAGKQLADVRFYLLGKNEVRFKGFEKERSKYPLVIDPDLFWGTFFDGGTFNFDEYLYGLEFNNSNDLVYCVGAANLQVSTAYAATLTSGYDGNFKSETDVFVYALTKNGQTVQFITYLGGSNEDVGIGISVNQNFIFVCGRTSSFDFPMTKSINGDVQAFDTTYHGMDDGFVAIFNLSLDHLVYSSFLGGPGDDRSLTIRAGVDSSYYVSLAGTDTLSHTDLDYLVASADNTFGGSSDGWIGEFTSMNTLRFGTYVGGNSYDLINDFRVLSNGDVVFVGNTLGITEVNPSVPNDPFGREVLFGKIHVPPSGDVSYDIIDKIGGGGEDYGWGIYSLGDSVSVLVGQTNSTDFPLGGGSAFQGVNRGNIDGFVARINNDGSGGYHASFVGGSDDDLLVSVTPVIINGFPVLLAFGTTRSTNLLTNNTTGGTFYSNHNSGGYDMMWVICNLNVTYKYYLSYIGGSNNDYLGKTAAPIGSNHLFFNASDSVLYLGTTTHSVENTQAPLFVGRGAVDTANAGIPVFDATKDNSNNDTHVVIAISIKNIFFTLPIKWEKFETSVLSDCSVQLSWRTATDETDIAKYSVERSTDGRNYDEIATIEAIGHSFSYNDKTLSQGTSKAIYRILTVNNDGKKTYSSVNAVQLCGQKQNQIKIYPTITTNYFVVSGFYPQQVRELLVEVIDAGGKKVMVRQVPAVNGAQTFFFNKKPAAGSYFVVIRNEESSEILHTQKITTGN